MNGLPLLAFRGRFYRALVGISSAYLWAFPRGLRLCTGIRVNIRVSPFRSDGLTSIY
jgi:hypothetical protein